MAIAYDPYEDEDYYTLTNPAFRGDRFAPGSEGAIAFDAPTIGGVRFPVAAPATGGQVGTMGAFTPDWQRVIDEMAERDRPMNDRRFGNEMDRKFRNEIEDAGNDPANVQQAIRLQGLMKYRTLIANGAAPAEAIRQAAPELYFNHPQATALATRPQESLIPPSITEVPLTGGATAVLANGRYRTLNRLPVVKDMEAELNRTEGNERVTQAIRALNTAQKALLPDDALIKLRERELEEARQSRRASTRSGSTLTPPATTKTLTKEIASELLKQAKGDKELARKLARDGGFKF